MLLIVNEPSIFTKTLNLLLVEISLKRFRIRSIKETNDLDTFDAGFKSISDFGKDDLMPHFIYCGDYYFREEEQVEQLSEIILTKMRKYGIQL